MRKTIFCTGPTVAAKGEQKSLVPARRAQQKTNQGRTLANVLRESPFTSVYKIRYKPPSLFLSLYYKKFGSLALKSWHFCQISFRMMQKAILYEYTTACSWCTDFLQEFLVKYLGKKDARGLWGIKHTRKPVDDMVALAR